MKFAIAILLQSCIFFTSAQAIKNTSYISASGEKVLRLETVLPVNKATAWKYFTKDTLLKKWIAPLAHIELKAGGYILTNYNENKSLDDSSSIKLNVINYLDEELLTLKVNLNNNFPAEIKNDDKNLQEIIQFKDAGNGHTQVISSMTGWGKGTYWNKAYGFFVNGNTWTYEQLHKIFE
jgi:hypothetical protein